MKASSPSTLDRRLEFERAHPEIQIIPPWTNEPKNESDDWLVVIPEVGTLVYPNAKIMMISLEGKYPKTPV